MYAGATPAESASSMRNKVLFLMTVTALAAILVIAQGVPSYETVAKTYFTNYARQVIGASCTIDMLQISPAEGGTNFPEGTVFTNGQAVIMLGNGTFGPNQGGWAGYMYWTMGTNIPIPIITTPTNLHVNASLR